MDDTEARQLLHAERERLTALLSDTADNVRELQDTEPGVADGAKDVVDRQLERSTLQQVAEQLREVDAALERVDAGTYGRSEISGEPIPDDRLRATPTTRRLVTEQQDAEQIARATDPSNPDLRG
ncbi:MAG: TraR/DksA family transcriptional regulator [Actinobacteria bacterium]|nr:TraR/DksA family transcriptional regulator [Actinomycetota bacterium]